MNGAMSLIQTLKRLGVRDIFGYPGGAIMPVYDALRGELNHILCRHEQGCAFAAQGYARSSNRVGVCMATSGPGATNLITGIADAYMDSIPLLVITGQVETSLMGTDAFQEIDFIGMTIGIVKHSYQVTDANALSAIVEEAYHLASAGRPGPVLIDLPKDIQRQQLSQFDSHKSVPAFEPPQIDSGQIQQVVELLRQARQPVLIAGGGIKIARAEVECLEVVEKFSIALAVTLNCIGLTDATHPNYLGMMGMHGTPMANDAIQAADLIISVGARFDDRATGNIKLFAPNAVIVHVDIDPAELNKNMTADLAIHGDAKWFLVQMISVLTSVDSARELHAASDPIEPDDHILEIQTINQKRQTHSEIHAPWLLQQFAQHLRPDYLVTIDVGQHQMWAAQHLGFNSPRQFMTSGGLGTMGFGLPAAIGVQIANPDKTVINITGDGSFMMNLQELATIKRYNLPIKILLLNNQHLGLVRQQQTLFYGQRYSEVDLSDNPDFTELAAVFGFKTRAITNHGDIEEALSWLADSPSASLLEVEIPANENVWPFVVPGKGNDERLNHFEAASHAI